MARSVRSSLLAAASVRASASTLPPLQRRVRSTEGVSEITVPFPVIYECAHRVVSSIPWPAPPRHLARTTLLELSLKKASMSTLLSLFPEQVASCLPPPVVLVKAQLTLSVFGLLLQLPKAKPEAAPEERRAT